MEKIKFSTDEYRNKSYKFRNYLFNVYPYGRGEWILSLYEYGARERKGCGGTIYNEYGFHFIMELSRNPITLDKARKLISEFLEIRFRSINILK